MSIPKVTIGRIVRYVNRGNSEMVHPALITRVYDEEDEIDLVAFGVGTEPILFIKRVPYDGRRSPRRSSWHWPPRVSKGSRRGPRDRDFLEEPGGELRSPIGGSR